MTAALMAAAMGIWLMIAPAAIGYAEPASTSDRVVGPIVASMGIVAAFDVTRFLRWVNLVLGVWLIAAPWVLGFPWDAAANSVLVGLAVSGLSLIRGFVHPHFGGGWRSVWSDKGERRQRYTAACCERS